MLKKWTMPKCPYCGERLWMQKDDSTKHGKRTLNYKESWACGHCYIKFDREVKYILYDVGELKERE